MVRERESMKIVVVGGGKMGLPLACLFADRGAQVTVCDTNPSIVQQINQGVDPHDEPKQQQYVHDGIVAGRLHASTATAAKMRACSFISLRFSPLERGSYKRWARRRRR